MRSSSMPPSMTERVADKRKANRKSITGALLVSLIVHVVLAVVAGIWIVASYIKSDPPQFEAPPVPKITIPPQTRQHRMNLAAHAALAAKPTFKPRLVSVRPTVFSLPEAPKVDLDHMLTPDPANLVNRMITGITGTAGAGAGTGFGLRGASGKGLGAGINFMGVSAHGQRILLLFDVSGSVVNKANASATPLAKIKEETVKMIRKLPADSRFGIIQFVRNYKMFQEELIAATQPNRQLACRWIETEWRETGSLPRGGKGVVCPTPNGLPSILRRAYEMKPDVIFLISDGSFERGVETTEKVSEDEWEDVFKDLTKNSIRAIPIHLIGFQMRADDQKFWERMTRRMGGSLTEIP
jgi:hypothetical protein